MLEPAPFPAEPEVFYDAFGPSVQLAAFGGSKVDALGIEYEGGLPRNRRPQVHDSGAHGPIGRVRRRRFPCHDAA